MTFVSHVLAWITAFRFTPWGPSKNSRAHVVSAHPASDPHVPASTAQSPEIWGALLALARLRRAARHERIFLNGHHDYDGADGPARAYVLCPEERQHTPYTRHLMETTR